MFKRFLRSFVLNYPAFFCLVTTLGAQVPYTITTVGPDSDGLLRFDLALPTMHQSDSFSDAVWIFAKYRLKQHTDTLLVSKVQGQSVFFNNVKSLPQPGAGVGFLGSDPNAPSLYVVSTHKNYVVLNKAPVFKPNKNPIMLAYNPWRHASLAPNGHLFPSHWSAHSSIDQKGIMLAPLSGISIPVNLNNVCLQLVPELQKKALNNEIELQLFAIPMVHAQEGPFWIGGTGDERGAFFRYPNRTQAYQIESESSLIMAKDHGRLWGRSEQGDDQVGAEGRVPESYPKGFASFYCMKYELTQGLYRDFLNSLPRHQQEQRVLMSWKPGNYVGGFVWEGESWSETAQTDLLFPKNRIGIRLICMPPHGAPTTFACDLTPSPPPFKDVNQAHDGAWHAMGQLSWMDLAAFLDWAALRPMTETEFEKVARGPLHPSPNELAHGSKQVFSPQKLINPLQVTEQTDSLCNVVCCNPPFVMGMTRVGSTQNRGPRMHNGASFYGAYDLSGNAWERVVSLSHLQGRTFTGAHGDGLLSVQGHANTPFWPGLVQGQVTGANGSAFRGGSWYVGTPFLRISDRVYGHAACIERFSVRGGRGVRTANSLLISN